MEQSVENQRVRVERYHQVGKRQTHHKDISCGQIQRFLRPDQTNGSDWMERKSWQSLWHSRTPLQNSLMHMAKVDIRHNSWFAEAYCVARFSQSGVHQFSSRWYPVSSAYMHVKRTFSYLFARPLGLPLCSTVIWSCCSGTTPAYALETPRRNGRLVLYL